MHYQFATELHIAEVRAIIEKHNEALGTKAFIEADRGDHVIFNYVVAFEGSFPEPNTGDHLTDRERAILRECRGLVMCKNTGLPLARRFQKFFNVNEKPETQIGAIDWSKPHVILEKLDGSMITPFMSEGRLRWGTKMGATDVAAPVEDFVNKPENAGYLRLAQDMIAVGATPIFEWCSLKQKIVIDYPKDRLVLTAVRNNTFGFYISYDEMLKVKEEYGVEVVDCIDGTAENIQSFLEKAQDIEGMEGYVIRFDSGHMVKVKGAWYVAIHKTKDTIQSEKAVWELILDDRLDDAKAFMDGPDRERVGRFHDAFELAITKQADYLSQIVKDSKEKIGDDKKRFAKEIVPGYDQSIRGLLFSIWDGHDANNVVRSHLRKHTGSGPRLEIVRPLIYGTKWEDYRDKGFVSDN